MNQTLTTVGWSAAALALAVTALWLVSLVRRDASVVDWFWAPGFALVAWVTMSLSPVTAYDRDWETWAALGVVSLWGLRLGAHLVTRNLGHGEDPRYAAMRERGGGRWPYRSLVTVFLFQGLLILILSAPVQVIVGSVLLGGVASELFVMIGLLAAISGVAIEGVADGQLKRFRKNADNRGAVLKSGLWAYCRHPNYFGNALLWWGMWIVALAYEGGVWTIFSPILITFLITKVSGVQMLELHLLATKPGYKDYVASTSAFVPWFRKDAPTAPKSQAGMKKGRQKRP